MIYQEKCVARIDCVLSTAESAEKRFKDAGIPWSRSIVMGVKHAALLMFEKYMMLAIEEVDKTERKEKSGSQAHQKCLDFLTGETRFLPCKAHEVKRIASVVTKVLLLDRHS